MRKFFNIQTLMIISVILTLIGIIVSIKTKNRKDNLRIIYIVLTVLIAMPSIYLIQANIKLKKNHFEKINTITLSDYKDMYKLSSLNDIDQPNGKIVIFVKAQCSDCKEIKKELLNAIDSEVKKKNISEENIIITDVGTKEGKALAKEVHITEIPTAVFYQKNAKQYSPVEKIYKLYSVKVHEDKKNEVLFNQNSFDSLINEFTKYRMRNEDIND